MSVGEHSGTHANAPASFHAGGAAIDGYAADSLVVPAVVIDISARRRRAIPTIDSAVDEIAAWERRMGRSPPARRCWCDSGWGARWGDPSRFLNVGADGRMHFPGVSLAAAALLIAERAARRPRHRHARHRRRRRRNVRASTRRVLDAPRLLLENLANLDQLPPVGATIVVGRLRLRGGTGSPATVLALV